MNCIVHGVAKSQTRLSDFHFLSLYTKSYFSTQTVAFYLTIMRVLVASTDVLS